MLLSDPHFKIYTLEGVCAACFNIRMRTINTESSCSQGSLPRPATFDIEKTYQLLYPLEIHSELTKTIPPEALLDPGPCESLPEEDDVTEQARPTRAASKKADEIRREWIAELGKDD